jgi:hypothetical protein
MLSRFSQLVAVLCSMATFSICSCLLPAKAVASDTFLVSVGTALTPDGESFDLHFQGGVAAFPVNGLAVGFEAFGTFPGDGSVWRLTPHTTYYLPMIPVIKPYLGAFYGRYIATHDRRLPAENSFGARAGIQISPGIPLKITAGAVYEYRFFDDCSAVDCDRFYPEVQLMAVF